MFECLRKRFVMWLLNGVDMVTKEEFIAAIIDIKERVIAFSGDTRVQMIALRETLVGLREQIANGGVLTEEDLITAIDILTPLVADAEELNQQVQAVDDE